MLRAFSWIVLNTLSEQKRSMKSHESISHLPGDGYPANCFDNLVQLLLIDSLCRFVLGFPPELVYGRVLPGAAVSILVGNLFYAYQAKKLAERTGRTDVCAPDFLGRHSLTNV